MKHSAASDVLSRIPVSADVMIWTVMNMQRNAKIISQREKIMNKYLH
nr:MAG TPA: hypothetical protein [Caudoviricetes sp.]